VAPSTDVADSSSTSPDDDRLARAEARAAEMEDRWLRVAAEFDNYRKRAVKDRDLATEKSAESALLTVIRVVDDLERAVDAAYAEAATVESLREGLALVLEHARSALRERGVEVVDPLGEPFDPSRHEAVLRNPQAEPNTISRVLARGYLRNGRVIRPAQVEVGG
jgi:molecular chaperone GrpE